MTPSDFEVSLQKSIRQNLWPSFCTIWWCPFYVMIGMMYLADRKWGLDSWIDFFHRMCLGSVRLRECFEFVHFLLQRGAQMHLCELFHLFVELIQQLCAPCLLASLLWSFSIWSSASATPYCWSPCLKAPDGVVDSVNSWWRRTNSGSEGAKTRSNGCVSRDSDYSF